MIKISTNEAIRKYSATIQYALDKTLAFIFCLSVNKGLVPLNVYKAEAL